MVVLSAPWKMGVIKMDVEDLVRRRDNLIKAMGRLEVMIAKLNYQIDLKRGVRKPPKEGVR